MMTSFRRSKNNRLCARGKLSVTSSNTKDLLPTPTNNAVEILEERLQRVIPGFDFNDNLWMNTTPLYLRVGYEDKVPIRDLFREF